MESIPLVLTPFRDAHPKKWMRKVFQYCTITSDNQLYLERYPLLGISSRIAGKLHPVCLVTVNNLANIKISHAKCLQIAQRVGIIRRYLRM